MDDELGETRPRPPRVRLTKLPVAVVFAAALSVGATACGDDTVESNTVESNTALAPATIDGVLDCPANEEREPVADLGGPGAPTADGAIELMLAGTASAFDGSIVMVDAVTGSVVVAGRELKIADAFESADGGWLAYIRYCGEIASEVEGGRTTPETAPLVTANG